MSAHETLVDRIQRFVVVDVETTGLYDSDRVVEVAAVTLSSQGIVLDEWDTLVNPERDVGATAIHGVTASMVSAAPRFEEIASALAARLHGAVLVAHNLPFDSRMLLNEYRRLGAAADLGKGICTLSASGQRLPDACARFGIPLERHHRALTDARATAELLIALRLFGGDLGPVHIAPLETTACPRNLRRDVVVATEVEIPYVAKATMAAHHRGQTGASLIYLDMLDWALADLEIDANEHSKLLVLASDLGLNPQEVVEAHERYLDEMVAAAARDHRVTDDELTILCRVASTLGIDTGVVEERVLQWRQAREVIRLEPGMRVCFTGAAISADGSELPRATLSAIAEEIGLCVVDSVTKKRCDLLVAADISSQSGKAGKARRFGIPIIEVQQFLCAESGGEILPR
jgi:DNA polymerase III subunit epsilon